MESADISHAELGSHTVERAHTNKLIAFAVGDQDYCVEIENVHEIRAWSETTPLPNTAEFVRGVINLRGSIVPIVDMKAWLNGGKTEPTPLHVIIVVSQDSRSIGLLVDAVSDILNVTSDEIEEIPDVSGGKVADYINGVVTRGEKMIAHINLDLIGKLTE